MAREYEVTFRTVPLGSPELVDETVALIKRYTGATLVGVSVVDEPATAKPAVVASPEVPAQEESFSHEGLAIKINDSFGKYLSDQMPLSTIGAVGGLVGLDNQPSKSGWAKQARWLDIFRQASEAEKAYITSVLEAVPADFKVNLFREHAFSPETLVEKNGLDINTASFLVGALEAKRREY